jgi:hypothetical protein
MKHSLAEVFSVIDGEREYQLKRWPGHKHTVGDYLTYMWHYYRKAEELDSTLNVLDMAYLTRILEPFRKLAALGVACMEENGFVTRIKSIYLGPATRDLVYLAIEDERRHQISVWDDEDDPQSTSTELTLIRRYLSAADIAWSDNEGDATGLDVLRKVVAIAIRCMQNHGAPPRLYSKKSGDLSKVTAA